MAILSVKRSGLLTTIQDEGRRGLRHLGIPWAGTMCPAWQHIANSLVGNSPDHPILEVFEGGFSFLVTEGSVCVSIIASDDARLCIKSSGSGSGSRALTSLRSVIVHADESLHIDSTGSQRLAIVAIQGLCTKQQLGSSSTYSKAGLGGIEGSALAMGHELSASTSLKEQSRQCQLPESLCYQSTWLRVVMGPQDDHFSPAGLSRFLGDTYTLSSEADRMGARLDGARIEHLNEAARDIVSDAIFPGSIQIPGSGKPIVLLNDAHTVGGYPKIATLVSADLPLLALQRPGSKFRFVATSMDDATASKRQTTMDTQIAIDSIKIVREPSLDSESLLGHNLIDGVTDGRWSANSDNEPL